MPLAAAVGWVLSRNISAPIITRTDVTARMTDGDLQTRASIPQYKDEIGTLTHSFNQMAQRMEDTIITLHQFCLGCGARVAHTIARNC